MDTHNVFWCETLNVNKKFQTPLGKYYHENALKLSKVKVFIMKKNDLVQSYIQ